MCFVILGKNNPTTMDFIANALRLLRASQGRPFVPGILKFAYSLRSGFSRRKKMNCTLNSGFLCASSLRGTKQSYNYGFHSERIKIASCLARTTVCVGCILQIAYSLPSGFSRRIKKRIANSTQGFLCASSF